MEKVQSSSRCGLGYTAGPGAGVTPGCSVLGDSISLLTGHQQVTREPRAGQPHTPAPQKAEKTLKNVFLKWFLSCQALRNTKANAIKQHFKRCLNGAAVESPRSVQVKGSLNCSSGLDKGDETEIWILSQENPSESISVNHP